MYAPILKIYTKLTVERPGVKYLKKICNSPISSYQIITKDVETSYGCKKIDVLFGCCCSCCSFVWLFGLRKNYILFTTCIEVNQSSALGFFTNKINNCFIVMSNIIIFKWEIDGSRKRSSFLQLKTIKSIMSYIYMMKTSNSR